MREDVALGTNKTDAAQRSAAEIEKGQAVYQPWVLRLYDLFVHGLSNRLLWRMPTADLQALFDNHVGQRHLDIGVGTGFFIDRLAPRSVSPKITLVDLNPTCLAHAAARLARFEPRKIEANALAPMDLPGPFDSASLCYLLHCMPGDITEKAAVFDHVKPHLAPGAPVFGATILQGDAPRNWGARQLMAFYNRRGIFSNTEDRHRDLHSALEARFETVDTRVIGCVGLFVAR